MWDLDDKESWAPKNWCFWTVVLGKTLESPLDCKEIQPVHSEGDQSWVFIGRTDVEAETPILWPSHAKSWLIGKDSDAGRNRGQEEKGRTEAKMAGWHHGLNGRESEWTPIPPSIRDLTNQLTLRMRWPKYWSFSFSIILSKEHPGLISFGMYLLQSKGLSRVFSNTTLQKHQFFGTQLSSQFKSHIHTWLLEKP